MSYRMASELHHHKSRGSHNKWKLFNLLEQTIQQVGQTKQISGSTFDAALILKVSQEKLQTWDKMQKVISALEVKLKVTTVVELWYFNVWNYFETTLY